jgi:cobyrinic acid a,c-diamide synthase
MDLISYPRIIIAGLAGDSGKTFVSCGVLSHFVNSGLKVAPFKKGPDYIDAAWLKIACGVECFNLDSFLIHKTALKNSFLKNSYGVDISIIEGNRGLFDGYDSTGSHSTAELAKLLKIPIVLVITVKKVTRTASAYVLGCKNMDQNLNIAGVIINQIAGKRHENIIREAIEKDTGIRVLGAIPKIKNGEIIPSRHLGLITPGEYMAAEKAVQTAKDTVEKYVDTKSILEIAKSAEKLESYKSIYSVKKSRDVKIGYFTDRIFSFYYPENLEALKDEGAELVKISSFEDKKLPDIDALYIGGGFPESNIDMLVENQSMMESVKCAADAGLPVYAECGGLIYLGDSINISNKEYHLSGVLPLKFMMKSKPQGHGYVVAIVDKDNPFYNKEMEIKGHEFHYSVIIEKNKSIKTCLKVQRGTGAFENRDGIIYKNVFASYVHIHSLGCPEWKKNMIKAARKYKKERN